METIIEWIKINRMQLNVSKTQMITIGKPVIIKSTGNVSIKIGEDNVISLGLIIDFTLNWLENVKVKTREGNSFSGLNSLAHVIFDQRVKS